MPPKSRKSISPWLSCNECQAIVSQKDGPKHNEHCPPSTIAWTHSFIKNKVVYSFLEQSNIEDSVKHVPKGEVNNIILLSQSALQICEICIGDPVVVTFENGNSAVLVAWPTLLGSLTTVLLSKTAMENISTNLGNMIKVKKIMQPLLPAMEISVTPLSPGGIPDDVSQLLQLLYVGRILCIGEQINVPYYGKKLFFKINLIQSHTGNCYDKKDLEHDFNNVSLKSKDELYKVVKDTSWIVQTSNIIEHKKSHRGGIERIGGLNKIITEVQELMQLGLQKENCIPGVKPIQGILLHGIPGVGKTLLAHALADSSGVFVTNINGPEIYSKYFGETELRIKQIFNTAKHNSPSIILIDDLDSICPRRNASDQEKRIIASLASQLDELHGHGIVIATCRQIDLIDRILRRPGRFDREIEISIPTSQARLEILDKILQDIPHQLNEDNVRQIAFSTHGFVGADILALCSQACMQASSQGLTLVNVTDALHTIKPSAMREVMVEVPSVRWCDIGGQHDLKFKLIQAIEWPLKHPEAFERLGIKPPRGVLMYGPPGCSKTMIAKALATESKLNFLSIKGPELFSKWVGESERAVREVFRRARLVAPSIVFFDELDALAGERSSDGAGGSNNVQERVLAQLLTELDGVEALGNVTVIGATNRPDRIDKALLRPGRLDRLVYVPLPDDLTREEIFKIQLKKTQIDASVDVQRLVQMTEGFSGAEVLAVCYEAALKALEESIIATVVSIQHFLAALAIVKPRTSAALLDLYNNYN